MKNRQITYHENNPLPNNQGRKNYQPPDLAVVYWKKYELENDFIIPEVIENFVKAHYEQQFSSSIVARKMALLKKSYQPNDFNRHFKQ